MSPEGGALAKGPPLGGDALGAENQPTTKPETEHTTAPPPTSFLLTPPLQVHLIRNPIDNAIGFLKEGHHAFAHTGKLSPALFRRRANGNNHAMPPLATSVCVMTW